MKDVFTTLLAAARRAGFYGETRTQTWPCRPPLKGPRIILLICLLGTPACADEVDTAPESRGPAAVDETHPTYSTDAHWVGIMLVAIAGLFLAAAVIGPIVRAEAPEVVPLAMSHEEDPAADRAGHDGESQ